MRRHTSCAFADNVRRAFYASGRSTEVVAYSPVTGERYIMDCYAATGALRRRRSARPAATAATTPRWDLVNVLALADIRPAALSVMRPPRLATCNRSWITRQTT